MCGDMNIEWGDDCWFEDWITLKWDAAAAAAAALFYKQEGEDISTGQRLHWSEPGLAIFAVIIIPREWNLTGIRLWNR